MLHDPPSQVPSHLHLAPFGVFCTAIKMHSIHGGGVIVYSPLMSSRCLSLSHVASHMEMRATSGCLRHTAHSTLPSRNAPIACDLWSAQVTSPAHAVCAPSAHAHCTTSRWRVARRVLWLPHGHNTRHEVSGGVTMAAGDPGRDMRGESSALACKMSARS